jgi:hypothetical protein
MNFDLEEELQKLIDNDKLSEAVQLAENELSKYKGTDFPKIIGKNLLNQVEEFEKYLDSVFRKMKMRSSIKNFFKIQEKFSTKAIYATINGFSINYDLWFVDFFKFDFIGALDDLDWLADGQELSINPFVLKEFKDIQQIYKVHHENKMYEYDEHEEAADICDYVVILRFYELFIEVVNKGKLKNKEWAKLSVWMGSHDCELTYRIN